ncbi:S8/S53 family peptidase [Microlunatus elymi]|uniref:S8/S53 family peptidase n=1 Tax=Microlunatus elymi TaxID=2596828 RepID=A0A516PZ27_9ACTN|nr:S53 family peptidase [Microlunatus elymi]QDP96402.1 S8/S53 family peptidase [Microlunatus elymi]
MAAQRQFLAGSARPPVTGAQLVGPAPEQDVVEATLVFRRRAEPESVTDVLTRDELAERYGAHPDDLAVARRLLTDAGLAVLEEDPASRRIRVQGSVAAMNAMFGVSLQSYRLPDAVGGGRVRHHADDLSLPDELSGIVTAVLGLDDRPQARPHSRRAAAGAVSYTPIQVGEAYQFPADTDGTGQTLALIELGGGFSEADLATYFGGLGVPSPTVTAESVDGAQNSPGNANDDGEVMLDIEIAGALAPAAKIPVYFAPNTDAGFLDAISQAAHAAPAPTVISISWGQSEDQWSAQSRTAMDDALNDAALLGVTVTVAAGDDGSADRQDDGAAHVDFPASSPHALGCGGTTLHATGSTVDSETTWNGGANGGATGGGVSDVFPTPSWQGEVGVPDRSGSSNSGRGVPDVAGNADPQTGYQVLVDGKQAVYGGTSAVAPLWAALLCRLAQSAGRPFGLLQPSLYAKATSGTTPPGFRDITTGDNGAYQAGPGWDPCTGLGVPVGSQLLSVLHTD